MSAVKQPLLRIHGNTYRLNPGDASLLSQHHHHHHHDSAAVVGGNHFQQQRQSMNSGGDVQHEEESMMDYDDNGELDERVLKTEKGYTASLNVPSALFKFILGKRGETKKRLEYDNKCQITVPGIGREGPIAIRGVSGRQVSSALNQIEIIAESSRKKLPFTHFFSIPVCHPDIQQGFLHFKQEVLDRYSGERGINMTLFQNPAKLHATIEVLTLLTELEIEQAVKVFQSCKEELSSILEAGGPKLIVQGLDYMNDDPTSVDVLYAKIRSSGDDDSLQKMANLLVSRFNSAGLLQPQFDRVKLHVTVMNALFRQDSTGTTLPEKLPNSAGQQMGRPKQRSNTRETFNAHPILQGMKDFMFGEIDFPGFHISQKHSTACDGYYSSTASIFTS